MNSTKIISERNKINTQSRADAYIKRKRLISKSDYNLTSGCTYNYSLNWKNPKNSLFWTNIYIKKNQKKTTKNKKTHWAGFFFKLGFFPTLYEGEGGGGGWDGGPDGLSGPPGRPEPHLLRGSGPPWRPWTRQLAGSLRLHPSRVPQRQGFQNIGCRRRRGAGCVRRMAVFADVSGPWAAAGAVNPAAAAGQLPQLSAAVGCRWCEDCAPAAAVFAAERVLPGGGAWSGRDLSWFGDGGNFFLFVCTVAASVVIVNRRVRAINPPTRLLKMNIIRIEIR